MSTEPHGHGPRPGRYTHGYGEPVLASHARRTAESSCGYLLPRLRPGLSLLDVGCGPGSITLDLAARVAPGRAVGVDSSPAALDAARASAARRGDTTTRFQQADVMSLPFGDAGFDIVHAHQVLQHLVDPSGALREISRVCSPGGLVAVRDVDYETMTWFPASAGLQRWLDTYRAVAHANGAEPDAGRRLRAWARAAGLREISVSASTWCYADADQTRWWGDSQADRVRTEDFRDQAAAQGLDADDVEAIARAWQAWGNDPDAYFVMVHTELLAAPPAR